MLEKGMRWVIIAVLLVSIAIAMNTLFPLVRGHVAMGVAGGVLLLLTYGIETVRE